MLRFLRSRWRNDSVRDKMVGKKRVYLERDTLTISEGESPLYIGWPVFIRRVIS